MRDVRLFPTCREYRDYVRDAVFAAPLLAEHPFYSRLIRFVVDSRAPIFFRQSDPSEYASFSVYYNFILLREHYTNPTLRALYFLHDFAHALFYYPYDVGAMSQNEFDESLIAGEYAASNETEILAHYRVPGLRGLVFQDRRILWDVLEERSVRQPTPHALRSLRRALVETDDLDPFFFVKREDEPVRALLKSYRDNGAWCKRRFAEIRALPSPGEFFYPFLGPTSYERAIATYDSVAKQEDYERTTLRNVRLAFALLGIEPRPQSFGECLERAGELEGRVLFPPARADGPGKT